jgi:hypothetical protein
VEFVGGHDFSGLEELVAERGWAGTEKTRGFPGILLEPALLDQFQARVGEEVEFGNLNLRILGVVEKSAPISPTRCGDSKRRMTAVKIWATRWRSSDSFSASCCGVGEWKAHEKR